MIWDFMFKFIETEEPFFVECENIGECSAILEEYGIKPQEIIFVAKCTVEEAEFWGFDTY